MSLKTKLANTSTTNGLAIKLDHVFKSYIQGGQEYPALRDVSFEIPNGSFVFIIGKSGSGKSTLLNMISGIDRPNAGQLQINSQLINNLSENELAQWRGSNVGIIFQFFQLIPTLTVLENILIAMDFVASIPRFERKTRAIQLLDRVGIKDQANKLPSRLSGGQQQRAAIARGLANNPSLIIADEPTGNLDTGTADAIYNLFGELVSEGKTVIHSC